MKNKKHITTLILLTLLFMLIFAISVSAESEAYQLYVSGVQVTSENAADVLGDGTVSYDSETKTLTLNNAKITDCYTLELGQENTCVGIYTAIDNLTVNLVGTNEIDFISHIENHKGNVGGTAIYSECNLLVKGDGSITLKAEFSIVATGSISITDSSILSGSFFGISNMSGDITLTNATIKTVPNEKWDIAALIFAQSSNIILENTTVVANDYIEMSVIYTMLGSITVNNSSVTTSSVGAAAISAGSMEQGAPNQTLTITNSELNIASNMMGIVCGGSLFKMENVKGNFQLTKDMAYAIVAVTRLEISNCELDIYAVPIEDGSLGLGGKIVKIDDSNVDITIGGKEGNFGIAADGEVTITESEVQIKGTSTAISGIYNANGNVNITDSNVGISVLGTEKEGLTAGIFTQNGYLTVNGGNLKIMATAPMDNELTACIYTMTMLPCKIINADVLLQGNKVCLLAPNLTEFGGEYELVASKSIDGSEKEEYSKDNITTYQYFNIHPFYEVTFDANGLEGTMKAVENIYGSFQLPKCTFTIPENAFFKGWALSKDGEIIEDPEITVSSNITLYAIWEEFTPNDTPNDTPSDTPNDTPQDHTHNFGTEYKSDAENHWKECACGEKIMLSSHVDNNENGGCDVCGSTVSKKGLGTGAIVAIVIASVLVVGGGGFSLYWFVLKKKVK